MKLTDMLISAIIKKGVLYEARNADIEFVVPVENEGGKSGEIKIKVKIDHMTLEMGKDEA